MGRIAEILGVFRGERNGAKITDIKADPGGQAIAQAQQFTAAGDDAHPLPGDYAIFVQLPSGAFASVGNIDVKNAQTAGPGGRRIYSRNTAGEQVAEVWLKNDGTVALSNDAGSVTLTPAGLIEMLNSAGHIKLLANGTADINGFTIDPTGAAVSPVSVGAPTMAAATSLTVNGVEMKQHKHAYSWTDPAGSGVTGAPQ